MDTGAEPYWLTLIGEFGCGKTMLAEQIFSAAEVINPGNPANNPIWPPDWAENGRHAYDAQRPYCIFLNERRLVQRVGSGEYDLPEYLRADFLVVLDELGFSRDPSNFASEITARLALNRARGWMVWCSNLTLDQINDRIDGRISSRMIRGDNRLVEIKAGDYALRKR